MTRRLCFLALLVTVALGIAAPGASARAPVQFVVHDGGLGSTGSGRVVSSPPGIDCTAPCIGVFESGTTVTLTLIPDAGSIATGTCGAGPTCQFVMNGNQQAFIRFMRASTLTVNRVGEGSVAGPPGLDCATTCSTTVENGSRFAFRDEGGGCVVSDCFTATPAPGSDFVGWSGGGCGPTPTLSCSFGLSTDATVTAHFAERHALTVAKSGTGGGTITSAPGGIDCGATCTTTFREGTAVTLTATPATGSRFDGWSGGGCSGTGTCTVTVNDAANVTATFTALVTLTVVRTGTGTGTVTSAAAGIDCGATCSVTLVKGTKVTLNQAAGAGSKFFGWDSEFRCDEDLPNHASPDCTITLEKSTTVKALFGIPRTVTIVKAGTGSGLVFTHAYECGPVCSWVYFEGDVAVLRPFGDNGSTFAGWSGCSRVIGEECAVLVDGDKTVTATFVADPAPPPPPPPGGGDPPAPPPADPGSPPPADAGSPAADPTPAVDSRRVRTAVKRAKRRVRFTFRSVGAAAGFECALARRGRATRFRPCTSPKTYKRLKRGRYVFRVRAGGDATPVRKAFRI